MVSPVSNNSAGLNALLRTQSSSNVSQVTNRQATQQAFASRNTPAVTKSQPPDKILDLASANSQPSPNLPRGSIVDKLV